MSTKNTVPFTALAIGALLALAVIPPVAAKTPSLASVATAGIQGGALVVISGTGPTRTLQAGGATRALPVWSADGRRIAFVQMTDRQRALADLVVVSAAGVELARVAIEPVLADTAYAGMRFVESLHWVSANRVAVRGSLNPSQSQYYVVDVATGQVVDDFIDDRSAAAFSPDGQHVATQSGSPHFVAAEQRKPQMSVDGKPAYPAAGASDVDFASTPRWSADSRSLAWLVRHRADASTALVVWTDGAANETRIPLPPGAHAGLFWSGPRVMVAATASGAGASSVHVWSADRRAGSLSVMSSAAALDPQAAALALRERLLAEARATGLTQPDVWCRACGLESLPRATD